MKTLNQQEFEQQNVFGLGAANDAYARYFTGQSYLHPLTKPEDGLFLANVTFEPGCRNNWHIHHAKTGGGQLLICTAGEGWYQEAGREAQSLTPGMQKQAANIVGDFMADILGEEWKPWQENEKTVREP